MLNNQAFLKGVTVVLALVVVGMLVFGVVRQQQSASAQVDAATATASAAGSSVRDETVNTPATLQDLRLGSFGERSSETENFPSDSAGGGPATAKSDLTLRIGVIGSTPGRHDVTTISSLPVQESHVRRAYRQSEQRACRMLIPNVSVKPPRSNTRVGQSGTFGRYSALTVGLTLSSVGNAALPQAVQSQVKGYFADHRLSIQPVLYYDASGQLYFGTDCQAAFFDLDRPHLTVKPEPMIADAVGRFRALGVVGGEGTSPVDAGSQGNLGRTLAMAFQFERTSTATAFASDRSRFATELLLLHIPADASVENPSVQLFITSDDRETLHRVSDFSDRLNSPFPTISATVRFDKTILMGLYPSSPVVTDIDYRSEGVVSMDSLVRLTQVAGGDGTNTQPMTVTDVLDQFGSGMANSSWMVEDRMRGLERRIGDSVVPPRGAVDPTLGTGLTTREKMMTGLAK